MSSIPLSRILQTKKTNGDAEKEQFDKQMVNISTLFSISPYMLFQQDYCLFAIESKCWSPVVVACNFKSKNTAILWVFFLFLFCRSVGRENEFFMSFGAISFVTYTFFPCWSFIAPQLQIELSCQLIFVTFSGRIQCLFCGLYLLHSVCVCAGVQMIRWLYVCTFLPLSGIWSFANATAFYISHWTRTKLKTIHNVLRCLTMRWMSVSLIRFMTNLHIRSTWYKYGTSTESIASCIQTVNTHTHIINCQAVLRVSSHSNLLHGFP